MEKIHQITQPQKIQPITKIVQTVELEGALFNRRWRYLLNKTHS